MRILSVRNLWVYSLLLVVWLLSAAPRESQHVAVELWSQTTPVSLDRLRTVFIMAHSAGFVQHLVN